MSAPVVDDLRRSLRDYRHRRVPLASHLRQAAVAAILRDSPAGAELLFIRRAEHPRDPWSGHMAFPGGRVDPEDHDALAAARRETREEINLELDPGQLIGHLSHLPAMAHGKPLPMVIVPFVFALAPGAAPDFALSDEVQEVLWVPLAFFAEPAHRGVYPQRLLGLTLSLPCYHFAGRPIWGLTLKMVDELTALIDR